MVHHLNWLAPRWDEQGNLPADHPAVWEYERAYAGRRFATDLIEQGWNVASALSIPNEIDEAAALALREARDPWVTLSYRTPDFQLPDTLALRESEVHAAVNLAYSLGYTELVVAYSDDPLRAYIERHDVAEEREEAFFASWSREIDEQDAAEWAEDEALEHARLVQEQEYSDSQRLDELATAEDYNRFEENQLALDDERESDYDDLPYDYLGGD